MEDLGEVNLGIVYVCMGKIDAHDCDWEGYEHETIKKNESAFKFCPKCDRFAIAGMTEPGYKPNEQP